MNIGTRVKLLVAAILLISAATAARFLAAGQLDWGIASSVALVTFLIGYLAATLDQAKPKRKDTAAVSPVTPSKG